MRKLSRDRLIQLGLLVTAGGLFVTYASSAQASDELVLDCPTDERVETFLLSEPTNSSPSEGPLETAEIYVDGQFIDGDAADFEMRIEESENTPEGIASDASVASVSESDGRLIALVIVEESPDAAWHAVASVECAS